MKKALQFSFIFSLFTLALGLSVNAQTTFFEDFESGLMPENFTLLNEDGLTPADEDDIGWLDTAWIVTTSSTFTGFGALSISWYEDEMGNEVGPADDWMILPKLAVSADSKLNFKAKSATSSGNFPDDFWVLVNAGEPTKESFENDGAVLLMVTDEESADFVDYSLDLADYAGQSVHLAFRNVTNTNGYGLWIDDIEVTELMASSAQEIDAAFFNLKVGPNPTSQFSQLQYDLPESAKVNVAIQNLLGQTVAELPQGNQAAGNYQIDLPVADLDNGLYQVVIRTEEKLASTRLVVAR